MIIIDWNPFFVQKAVAYKIPILVMIREVLAGPDPWGHPLEHLRHRLGQVSLVQPVRPILSRLAIQIFNKKIVSFQSLLLRGKFTFFRELWGLEMVFICDSWKIKRLVQESDSFLMKTVEKGKSTEFGLCSTTTCKVTSGGTTAVPNGDISAYH